VNDNLGSEIPSRKGKSAGRAAIVVKSVGGFLLLLKEQDEGRRGKDYSYLYYEESNIDFVSLRYSMNR